MSDMRLIVAGAGGRMGRALTRAISESKGAVLAGALEAPGSELLGKDAESRYKFIMEKADLAEAEELDV